MKVLDPGHKFSLDSLDGDQENILVFVKREGEKYPGNVGHNPGTTMQEVLRALISRAKYVNNQIYSEHTNAAINNMEVSLYYLEERAAERHGRKDAFYDIDFADVMDGKNKCTTCGHVGCKGDCHAH
jgi:hypothetical protein